MMLSGPGKGIGLLDSPKTPEYESIGPTRILPHLYIGCMKDALSFETRKTNGITDVLNVSTTCDRPPDISDEHFLRIPVNDGYIDNLQAFFPQAHQFIDKVKLEKGKVMVHCQAGISRSAALTISYIMNSRRISCEQAYRFVKMMRPIVSPNFNFLGQLLEYEKELNVSASPTATAGSKRKRINMNLPLDSITSVTDSPQRSKRLVVENNNSISSLSPASALAGLKFEHSIGQTSCPLPGPSAAAESTIEMKHNSHLLPATTDLAPPKRCHSWNGLANLALATPSPTNDEASNILPANKKSVGVSSRPRSLNLSMSHLAVPPAVLELNAKVDKDLYQQKSVCKYTGSVENILETSEDSEPSLSKSNSGVSLSLLDVSTAAPQTDHLIFKEIETGSQVDQLSLIKDGCSTSQPSLSPATPTLKAELGSKPALAELTMSQPLLKTFQSSLERLETRLISTHAAPDQTAKGFMMDIRRRSYSLGNLVSCIEASQSTDDLCMKCGRNDKHNLCHRVTATVVADYLDRPRSIHDSLEMIEVT
ncbi:uncharacterized protein [Watersipora subatra]|uniref:uncharacterized protein n=1 Tax=Watersipora subatra TaxID=2589382 RepID=UPI00355C6F82